MENKQKNNFTKLTSKGISLIVLIITIIVIIILSTVIVMTLNSNNPISSAREAVFKEDISNFKSELEMYKTEMKMRKEKPENLNATKDTDPSIQDIITNMTDKYAKILEVINGKLVYVGKNKIEYMLAHEMGLLQEGNLLDDEILEELQPFITEWTVSDNDSITLPVIGTCDFTVDYGDGTGEYKVTSSTDEDITHTYEKAGTYTVTITGICSNFSTYNKVESKDKLTKLVQWGSTGFISINFKNCTNLTGPIPEPSENSLKNVSNLRYLFDNCTALTGEIPENLFANCIEVTSFDGTFRNCISLTGEIPDNLFANCVKATNFNQTFIGCENLTGEISDNLFKSCPEITNFSGTFYKCKNLTGNAPALWERENVTNYSYCFRNCTNLLNYADIPNGWK